VAGSASTSSPSIRRLDASWDSRIARPILMALRKNIAAKLGFVFGKAATACVKTTDSAARLSIFVVLM
jgi:hypothetical protein